MRLPRFDLTLRECLVLSCLLGVAGSFAYDFWIRPETALERDSRIRKEAVLKINEFLDANTDRIAADDKALSILASLRRDCELIRAEGRPMTRDCDIYIQQSNRIQVVAEVRARAAKLADVVGRETVAPLLSKAENGGEAAQKLAALVDAAGVVR